MEYLNNLEHLLSVVIFFPLLAGALALMLESKIAKIFGIMSATIELLLVCALWAGFDLQNTGMQFEESIALIPSLGISYHVGIDGISLVLMLLNALIIVLSSIYMNAKHAPNHFIACLLILESILMCVFSAQNVLLFYIGWELSLLPILYMIGVWGSGEKIKAALKFFLYTFLASLMMLLGMLYYAYLHFLKNQSFSFELNDWLNMPLPSEYQAVLFFAFFFAIAVKIPIIPFHAWLPHAYGNAPTLGSVALSALLLKMGTYAIVRFLLPLFPDASYDFSMPIIVLALVMILYGAFVAYAQRDMKQVIAYSSISHMGVVVLGCFSFTMVGIGGAVFMMFAHGVVSAALFMMIGMFSARVNTRDIASVGGFARVAPYFCASFGIVLMANVGLPLSIGFVGEFLSILGMFLAHPIMAFIGGMTIIFSAVYMLSLYKRLFFGAESRADIASKRQFLDLNAREKFIIGAFIALIVFFGVYPKPLLNLADSGAKAMIDQAQYRAQAESTKRAFGLDSKSGKEMPSIEIIDYETMSPHIPESTFLDSATSATSATQKGATNNPNKGQK